MLTDEVKQKLANLVIARRFNQQCINDGDNAMTTGALRDSREGLRESIDELIDCLPPEVMDIIR